MEAGDLYPGAPGMIHAAVFRCERAVCCCHSRCTVGLVPIYVAAVFHCHPCGCQEKKMWQLQFVESQRDVWEKDPDRRGGGLSLQVALSREPPSTQLLSCEACQRRDPHQRVMQDVVSSSCSPGTLFISSRLDTFLRSKRTENV